MKTGKIFALILAAVTVMSLLCIGAYAAPYEIGDGYIKLDYSHFCAGLTSGKPDAIIEKNVNFEGRNAMKFTPAPDNAQGSTYVFDTYSLHQFAGKGMEITLPDYKFIGITYYYETDDPTYRNKPLHISILPGATKVVTGYASASSNNNIVTNQWATAYFNLSDAIAQKFNPETDKPYISQIHFYPFGSAIKPGELLATDVFYVSEMTFYKENPDKDAKIDVAFNKGNPEAKGEDASYLYGFGEEYTLPENPYDFGESEFLGWLCSYDGKLYQPGEKFKAERSVYYTASWNVVREYADSVTLSYSDYEDGPVNSKPVAIIEQTEKDGRTAVKITATPEGNPENTLLSIDGYNYKKAGIDLGVYRWATMEYYYESDKPVTGEQLFLSMLRSGDVFIEGQHYANAYATEDIIPNTWAIAIFDFSILDERINKANTDLDLRQMHFRPWGKTYVNNLTNNDVMYIGNLTFYKEKPDIATHTSYMNGYEDGTFKPAGTMTRAEACTVVARLLEREENITGTSAFADVAGHWAEKYIGFCEAKGLLASYSGNFEPGKAITRAEFSELVYLTGLAQDKGIAASFADVDAAHPKYTSIMAAAKAGLINGYDEGNGTFTFKPDNTVTRAEVVTIINRARSTSKTSDKLTHDISVLFLDVDDTHWAFADIAEATVSHIEMGGIWQSVMKDPAVALSEKLSDEQIAQLYKFDEGKAKIAELDTLEAKRIEEIRSTPNMDISNITGKKIYVSSSTGDDSNDGQSEGTPVKTLSKASSMARADDVILLKRGDTFRERITAKADVTYTAYGEGEKPILNGSPENGADASMWSLVHEDTATGALIWQYNNGTMVDIGAIVFNDGEGYAIKDVPYYLNEKFVLKGNTAVEYDYKTGLDHNFKFFHAATRNESGILYLRCDNGNPGKIFDSIEFIGMGSLIAVSTNNNVTIDNLCLKYSYYGVTAATQKNLTVTNCEIGWIGGNVGSYNEKSGVPTRAGNAVEVYGGCDGYIVDNCYIYQCYDAGVTQQVSAATKGNLRQDNIKYTNNVITDCVYSVEYFFGADSSRPTEIRAGENFLIENNLLRRAGYGFGSSRPDINNQRHIRSGSSENEFTNFEIKNNIFDRAVHELLQVQSFYETTLPVYSGNTYIQGIGNKLYLNGNESANTNPAAEKVIKNVLGDADGKVYFTEYIPLWSFSYTTDKTAEVTEEDRKVVEPTKPNEEESSQVATDTIQPTATESGTVKAPSVEKLQAKARIYNELKPSVKADEMTDSLLGMKYMHFTFENTEDRAMLNCYGFNATCEEDVVYIKVLMRTNLKVKPSGMLYQLYDENGNATSGNKSVAAINETIGNGEWETVIMRASGFPDGTSGFKQMQFFIAGSSTTGAKFYDGTYPSDGYIDIAGWAVFPNLASANAYSLMEASLK